MVADSDPMPHDLANAVHAMTRFPPSPKDDELPLSPPFLSDGGACWIASLPSLGPGDDEADNARSHLVLKEDGRPLGPAHGIHADIRSVGGGAYSHWKGSLRFSTSDNSDPNLNGRRYTVCTGMPARSRRGAIFPAEIFRSHPVYGWSLAPGTYANEVGFRTRRRHCTYRIGADGYRIMPRPEAPRRKLWFFGCSYTFGTFLDNEETFAHQIAVRHPDWDVRNFGVSGYGTLQGLLQLRELCRSDRPDLVFFLYLRGHHATRNAGAPSWLRANHGASLTENGANRLLPRGVLVNAGGDLKVEYIPLFYPGLLEVPVEYVDPGEYHLAQVTLRIFQAIQEVAASAGARLAVGYTMAERTPFGRDHVIPGLAGSGVRVIDMSFEPSPDRTFLPDDSHPNEVQHGIWAEQLDAVIGTL